MQEPKRRNNAKTAPNIWAYATINVRPEWISARFR